MSPSPLYCLRVILAASILPSAAAAEEPRLRVAIDPVIERRLTSQTEVFGRFITESRSDIPSRLSGAIDAIHVEVGDRVARGDVLATLVLDRLKALEASAQARLAAGEARIETARAAWKIAQQELDRLESLRQSAAFPKARYQDQIVRVEQAKSALADARAQAQGDRAALTAARIDLEWARIKAPYDGIVTRRYRNQGAWASAGEPVVELVDVGAVEIEADIPAHYAAYLQPGMEVTYRLDENDPDARHFPAFTRAILDQEDIVTRTRLARFSLPGEADRRPRSIVVHQPVVLSLPSVSARRALLVHKDAILTTPGSGNEARLFIVEDGRARMRMVVTGESDGHYIEILEGLKGGENVIIRGNERLAPGQAVRFADP